MYTVSKITHEGPCTNKYGVWASDGTLFAVCELRGEAQMITDALNEADKRLLAALSERDELCAEVERLRETLREMVEVFDGIARPGRLTISLRDAESAKRTIARASAALARRAVDGDEP